MLVHFLPAELAAWVQAQQNSPQLGLIRIGAFPRE